MRDRVIVKVVCPKLDSPTLRVVQSFEDLGKIDPESEKWIMHLDDHYQKLDKCKVRR